VLANPTNNIMLRLQFIQAPPSSIARYMYYVVCLTRWFFSIESETARVVNQVARNNLAYFSFDGLWDNPVQRPVQRVPEHP
jgi:hypothetical protein